MYKTRKDIAKRKEKKDTKLKKNNKKITYLVQRIQVINSSFSVNHEGMLVHFNVGWTPGVNEVNYLTGK
jgi:hypothetical protein